MTTNPAGGVPATISIEPDGWRYDGRLYDSLVAAGEAVTHPRLDVGRALGRLTQGPGEGVSAYEVLDTLADALLEMRASLDLPLTAIEADLDRTLVVCATKMQETARAIGRPPRPSDGPF